MHLAGDRPARARKRAHMVAPLRVGLYTWRSHSYALAKYSGVFVG